MRYTRLREEDLAGHSIPIPLWFLSITFVLSSLINWAIHHIHFTDVGIYSIGSILIVILIACGSVFILRWFDVKRPQFSPETSYPLTLGGRQQCLDSGANLLICDLRSLSVEYKNYVSAAPNAILVLFEGRRY